MCHAQRHGPCSHVLTAADRRLVLLHGLTELRHVALLLAQFPAARVQHLSELPGLYRLELSEALQVIGEAVADARELIPQLGNFFLALLSSIGTLLALRP